MVHARRRRGVVREVVPVPAGLAALIAAVLALGGCVDGSAGESRGSRGDDTPTAGSASPAAPDADRADWPAPNGDHANTREARHARIDAGNVATLEVAWTWEPSGVGAFGSLASEPIVVDGVVYAQDLASNVVALDLDTGEVIWELELDQRVVGPNGAAVDDTTVYVPAGNQSVLALDRATGEERWRAVFESAVSQPRVVGDTLFASTNSRNSSGGVSGMTYALDAATGEQRWSFQVVEEGFWGNPEVNGGGGVWMPAAVDLDRGQVLWGTGNPSPFPGTVEHPNGSSRPGENLYTNSVIALDLTDGTLQWYDHVEPDDLFDHDVHGSPVLVDDVEVAGARRDVAIGSGKNGKVGAWDRDTGERLWLVEVGVHQNSDLTELPIGEPVEVYPGILGGVETPKAVADGVVYVPVVDLPTTFEATGFGAESAHEALARLQTPPPSAGSGQLVALDLADGSVRWQVELEQPTFAGATVVNDLVFTATFDGTILAFDRDDGTERWRFAAPAGINAWPAVAGDTIVWGAGAGPEPALLALRLRG